MNIIRLLLATVAAFVVIFFTNYIIHQVYLASDYAATSSLWRTPAAMQSLFLYMLIGSLVLCLAFVLLFTQAAKHTLATGLLYGLFIGLFSAGSSLGMYAVLPVPFELVAKWMVTGVIQMVLVGAVVGMTYRR